jgi:hypothetical protein
MKRAPRGRVAISVRIGDLEIRTREPSSDIDLEILQWQPRPGTNNQPSSEEYCFSVAWWIRDSEEYSLHFIGDRPLRVDRDVFWTLVTLGQQLCREILWYELDPERTPE